MGVQTVAPWVLVQITGSGTQNQQKRKLFCSHCSLTPQQGMISPLNCLNHLGWFYQGSCLLRIEWCVSIQPCASVVDDSTGVYVGWVRSMCVGVRGDGLEEYVFLL